MWKIPLMTEEVTFFARNQLKCGFNTSTLTFERHLNTLTFVAKDFLWCQLNPNNFENITLKRLSMAITLVVTFASSENIYEKIWHYVGWW